MTNDAQKLLLLKLLDKLLKSWWTLVAGVCVGASLAVVALHFTIPVYEAQATIVADVERLPSELILRTVSDDVAIQLGELRHAVLSDENLQTVITTVMGTPHSQAHEQALADEIRSDVTLRFTARTQAIDIHYRNQIPKLAARITNMLAEFFVVENKGLRTASAARVLESMESLAAEVELEYEEKLQELNDLLSGHARELESQRSENEQAIERLIGELETSEKAFRTAKRRLGVLEAQLARSHVLEFGDASPADEGVAGGEEDPQIIQIEQELEKLLITRTENHPDVVAKRRELERLRPAFKGGGDTDEIPPETAEEPSESRAQLPGIDMWQTRVHAAKLETERLERRSQEISRELSQYRGYIANTPLIQQRVDELESRVEVLRRTNLENQRKIETARTGQELEQKDIANPFTVTRYATPPVVPVSPNRLMFLLAGVAGGLLLFTGPVLAQAWLSPSIVSEACLSLLADIPLLVAIPVIPTPARTQLQRRAMWRNVGLSVLALSVATAVAAMQLMGII